MKNEYQNSLDQLKLTEESKTQLIQALKTADCTQTHPHHQKWKLPLAAAAAIVCLMTVTPLAVKVLSPVIADHYQNSPGYQQSMVELGDSITKHGWTLTMTDAVIDNYNISIGFQLDAPQGTVLDCADGYQLEQWDLNISDFEHGYSVTYRQIEDPDPNDNSIQFMIESQYVMREDDSLQGKTLSLRLGGLFHTGEWNETDARFERIFDCDHTWKFSTKIDLPAKKISLEPNVTVHTLDVDATLTHAEITPFGAYVYIEGDSLKGHHSWVPKNAPDGWYGCIEYQEIVLHMKDGTSLPLPSGNGNAMGSGCSGGTDSSETGYLHIARRAENLIDVNQVDSISICGVTIPVK